ncbi:MAG: urease accessory protein UreF [Gammaproteobacteria bacterium]|nr:urease accessory protein UreF [Gammaproteobacteria bacterium]
MAITITDAALLRLLQLASPALPVGAYAFSQGLESAVELGWITDQKSTGSWLDDQLRHSLAAVDLPLLLRMMNALRQRDHAALRYWNDTLLACRETAELRLGELATGEALARLLAGLEIPRIAQIDPPTFLLEFCTAALHFKLSADHAALGYLWSWLENQVMAATKLVPLGQTQAQRLLSETMTSIPAAIACARAVADEDIGASLPGIALASVQHERQYSRLFRS